MDKHQPFLQPKNHDTLPIHQSPDPDPDPDSPTRFTNLIPRFNWSGVKLVPFIIAVAAGLLLRFAVPKPTEVTDQAWQLLAIFVTTIAGLILGPVPLGAWAFVCLTATVVTKTLSFQEALSALTNDVIWLIVVAFFFSRGFVKSGLGDRVANYFIRWWGRKTIGLAYGLVLSEALVSPAIPSSTARAGGVFSPVIMAVATSSGSLPNDPSANKLGSFLALTQMQSAGNSSALFLTAAAQNLLCIKLADELGVKFDSPWIDWFKFASLPALVGLLLNPIIMYKLYPPGIKDTPDAPALASERLTQMGPIRRNEWIMIATMLLAVGLWATGDRIGMPNVVAAMLALSLLVLLGVLQWDDCLAEKAAWDTLVWFAVLVGLSGQLTNLGFVSWMSTSVANGLKSLHVGPTAAFAILQVAYFFVHYLFASQTAHVGALYSAFLGMNLAAGVSGKLAALALAYSTNLFVALTHYSSGGAAVYYGAGYLKLHDVFKFGFIMAIINGIIWVVVGAFWWKILGLY